MLFEQYEAEYLYNSQEYPEFIPEYNQIDLDRNTVFEILLRSIVFHSINPNVFCIAAITCFRR